MVTWIAVNNDPFERERGTLAPYLVDGKPVMGPTLTLLCDEESPYAGRVRDVVLLHRPLEPGVSEGERHAVEELTKELEARGFRVHHELWRGEDPTEHRDIFRFLRGTLPSIRRQFEGQELVLHISPGTPTMHTIWVLMGETGFVEPPFTLVKSYRRSERRDRPAVVRVELGIETFYKAYRGSRPRQVASDEQLVLWDPKRFESDAMKRVFAEARRFAQLNVPILIRGERGTGKTTLANWIRSNSPFKRAEQNAQWPSVACGQYNAETMRAELFGYKKGAFTGANADRDGLLAAAHGDTLFLDEVGDVSSDLQRLLIRAIEERRYFPLGDDTSRESDFRLLTATNIDDAELRRRLDPDFLDRISLFTLTLPALRDVPAELPWLWEAVFAEATRRAGVSKHRANLGKEHHERVIAHLKRHPLPGNLRDLFRIAFRILAARHDDGDPLSPSDATAYGLESLGTSSASTVQAATQARSIAAAFAHGSPIDDLLSAGERVETEQVIGELRAFLSTELRRIARERGVKVDTLCDKSERTLQNWKS
ncbi:hypothetical protein DV096_18415 [Bradymonadaceae bacterium TMQ3]|nr:hypothetical protein DV096_18415 [Bradymonadaceae bacterium TMQ3]